MHYSSDLGILRSASLSARIASIFAAVLTLCALVVWAAPAGAQPATSLRSSRPGLIENLGQWPDAVVFAYHAPGQVVWFTRDGYVIDRFTETPLSIGDWRRGGALKDAVRSSERRARGVVVAARLVDSNTSPTIEARNTLPGRHNYFVGDQPERWRSNVASYSEIWYRGVYPGVDLVYRFDESAGLKYDVLFAPGVDPRTFALRYAGNDGVAITAGGDLRIDTAEGEFLEERPVIYQERGGQRIPVAGAYALRADGSLSFDVPSYDRTLPLVIDPRLSWSTFFGGAGIDVAQVIASDANAHVVVAGYTNSIAYPTTVGAYDRTANGNNDCVVTKFDASGGLRFSTFIGGSGNDYGQAVMVDGAGNTLVAGYTTSTNFPTTVGAYDRTYGGGEFDAVLLKLSPDGSALTYSTLFGSTGFDVAYGVAVSSAGNPVIVGFTSSSNLPTTPNAFDATFNGYFDGFISVLNSNASALVHSTFLGGAGEDLCLGLALGPGDRLIVGGSTQSTDFPTSIGAYDRTWNGDQDGFLALYDLDNEALGFSTYIGGSSMEYGYTVAVDGAGRPVLGGETSSPDYPLSPRAFDSELTGATDAFVTKLNAAGSALVFSTFLGGESFDYVQGIVAPSDGSVIATGATFSTDFQITGGAFAGTPYAGGIADAFVTRIGRKGEAAIFSSCLGGSDIDAGYAIALAADSRVIATGYSASMDFPTTLGAYDRSMGGVIDVYVTSMPITSEGSVEKNSVSGASALAAVELTVESPARATISARVTMPRGGAATIEVLDVSGRRVLERRFDALPAGLSALTLDGAAVRALAPGLYMLRVMTGEGSAAAKLTVVR
ncbi:MAG: SBBP repeat-containing protein [bacterium]